MESAFGSAYVEAFTTSPTPGTLDQAAGKVANAMREASKVAARPKARRHQPWITGSTIALFAERDQARREGSGEESALNKEIKKAVRQDKRIWLESTLVGGSWKAVRELKKTPAKTPVTIKNADGEVVESNQRANVLADYFEHEQ